MRILQVNNTDLPGRRFNGYDLNLTLNALGYETNQIVLEKFGDAPTTIPLCSTNELFVRSQIRNMEHQLSLNNLLYPFGKKLFEHPIFQNADLIHFHLLHNHFISIFDLPQLTTSIPSVWTIHDPWLVTGHCVHPLDCKGWLTGCYQCPQLDDPAFPMKVDKASQMWKIKKSVFQELGSHLVVASNFMEDYIRNSPLTGHIRNVHRIPFGIDVDQFQSSDKDDARHRLRIPANHFVIAFRADPNELKGLKLIIEMLHKLDSTCPVTLLTVGVASIPAELSEKFQLVELGWLHDDQRIYDFYAACDVFLMPSLAESFGLMAIEAMAAGRAIIVFEGTVLAEITFAPECGIAVPYKDINQLGVEVVRLMQDPQECRRRGDKGLTLAKKHYRYEDYVNRHISLYHEVIDLQRVEA